MIGSYIIFFKGLQYNQLANHFTIIRFFLYFCRPLSTSNPQDWKICSRFFLTILLAFPKFHYLTADLILTTHWRGKDPSKPRINSFGCESNCPNCWPLSCGIRNIWDHVQSLTATARCCNRRDFGISRRGRVFPAKILSTSSQNSKPVAVSRVEVIAQYTIWMI